MSDFSEKRRFDRVELAPDEALFMHLLNPDREDDAHTVKVVVSNVSLRGCRVQFPSGSEVGSIQEGRQYVVSLNVDSFAIPLTVQVLRKEGQFGAAIVFKPPYPRELSRLERFLEPRTLGSSLREIRPEALQGSSALSLRWFQGVNDTHLFSWFDASTGEVTQQQLVFLGSAVEWQKELPIKTGHIKPDIALSEGSRGWVSSELLMWDHSLDHDLLRRAGQLLRSSPIDVTIKNVFLNKLGFSQKD